MRSRCSVGIAGLAAQVLVQQVWVSGFKKSLDEGQRGDDASGDVLNILGGLVPVIGKLVFADIGNHRIRITRSESGSGCAMLAGRPAQDLDRFGVHDQPGQLFPDMGRPFRCRCIRPSTRPHR